MRVQFVDSIQIEGGISLQGQIKVQGSKNATLPILAATVLIHGISIIENCPRIADVNTMVKLLQNIGCTVNFKDHSIIVDATSVKESRLPKEDVTKMRSSIMLMGALLGRLKRVSLDYPGGCVIGKRPVDFHLQALKNLGITIEEEENSIIAFTEYMTGCDIHLPFASVGATENCILAAVCAQGKTKIFNAAKEPEISALCQFLNQTGAKIQGIGTSCIIIEGVESLHGTTFCVPSDRIVAGTYVFACVACGGDISLLQAPTKQMGSIISCAERMGSKIMIEKNSLRILRNEQIHAIPYIKTEVYPGFPTDIQSMLMVACALAEGTSRIEETIFENRYKMVKELRTMGAKVKIDGSNAYITGVSKLQGKHVIAEELRGGAALVIAGMAAYGITVVNNKYFIDRGYEDICKDLSRLGARINVE